MHSIPQPNVSARLKTVKCEVVIEQYSIFVGTNNVIRWILIAQSVTIMFENDQSCGTQTDCDLLPTASPAVPLKILDY